MTENKLNALIRQRTLSLQEKRKALINLPAEQLVEKILNAARPVELVHSFPEEDLYLLVNEIGPEDALPVLSLASAKQWEYMLDMDIWKGDRANPISATRWISLFLAADPDRLSRWCLQEKKQFTEFFLYHNLEAGVREEDQDPTEFAKDFFTFDDIFYFRVREPSIEKGIDSDPEAGVSHEHVRKQRKKFFQALLMKLAAQDFQQYQNLLLDSAAIIPAETEEELYRLRNIRLAEKGFLPLEEAVGVYQPIKPREIRNRPSKFTETESEDTPLSPAPLSTVAQLEESTHFARALAAIDRTLLQMQLQSEFAGLCNSLIVADRETIQTRQSLGGIVKKACGYISIGLDYLSGDHSHLIQTYPLSDIFRVGYGKALALKWRAEAWQKDSWYMNVGLHLHFWGEAFMGVVGGLLIQKPLFFDNYATGTIYREFSTADDIRKTQETLNAIITLDNLLFRLEIDNIPAPDKTALTYKNLLLSLWAAHLLGLSDRTATIPVAIQLEKFRTFFNDLWDNDCSPRRIRATLKTSFLDWLSDVSRLPATDISSTLGRTLESLFGEIENEYASISVNDLDPRYIHLFRVTK